MFLFEPSNSVVLLRTYLCISKHFLLYLFIYLFIHSFIHSFEYPLQKDFGLKA